MLYYYVNKLRIKEKEISLKTQLRHSRALGFLRYIEKVSDIFQIIYFLSKGTDYLHGYFIAKIKR